MQEEHLKAKHRMLHQELATVFTEIFCSWRN